MATVFFHADIDAFYAHVELLDNPDLKGKPVIVGGSSSRGVVSTCSYEARKFGVHSGMPILSAKKLCPNGVFLPVRMKRYCEKSHEVMRILKSHTPEFQQLSIDEGFLNMSGMQLLFGSSKDIAKNIKREIFEKTQLTVSIGIARTKYFAKLASDFSKPNGLYEIKPKDEIAFIQRLPMEKIWGIGKTTLKKLQANGIIDTQMLASLSLEHLQLILGKASGQFVFNVMHAQTDSLFNDERQSHSISSEQTFETDLVNMESVEDVLFQLATEISMRMLAEKVTSNTVFVKIRYHDFKTYTIQEIGTEVTNALEIFSRAKDLFYRKYETGKPIRLLGIGVLKVAAEKLSEQPELFQTAAQRHAEKQKLVEKTALSIAKKNGKQSLTRARLIPKKDK